MPSVTNIPDRFTGGCKQPRPQLSPTGTNDAKPANGKSPLQERKPRHAPLGASDAIIEFLTVCEAERTKRGLSYAEVGRLADVDKADVHRALTLAEKPSVRTLSRLSETLVPSEVINKLPLDLAQQSALLAISYHAKRLSELTARFAEGITP